MQKSSTESHLTFFKNSEKLMKVGFYMGIASFFLSSIGIIPLSGMILSIMGVVKFDKSNSEKLWMGITGIILNFIFLLANAHQNGNI